MTKKNRTNTPKNPRFAAFCSVFEGIRHYNSRFCGFFAKNAQKRVKIGKKNV